MGRLNFVDEKKLDLLYEVPSRTAVQKYVN